MKVLLVEDEFPAYQRLKKMIEEILPEVEWIGHDDSIA